MYKFTPSKELLQKLYWEQNLTIMDISQKLNVSTGKIHKLIHLYGIKINRKFRKPMPASFREKIRAVHLGKKMSAETKEKLKEYRTGRYKKRSKYGGHKKYRRDGYVSVYCPNHPSAHKDGYVLEHVLVYEKAHNMIIDKNIFCVHHINGIKTDNRPENLILMSKSEHATMHLLKRHKERREKLCKELF